MSSEQAITHDFDKLLAQYPGFFKELVAYIDDIRQYGSLKQAIAEAENQLALARVTVEAFQADAALKRQSLEDAYRVRQEQIKQEDVARSNAVEMQLIDARNQAGSIVEQAKAAAEQIMTEAQVAAAAVAKRTEAAQEKAAEIESATVLAEDNLTYLKNQIAFREADLARIESSIADLRAKIA